MLAQARAMKNGIVVMAFTGGSNLEGTKGHHLMVSPAYNVTREQIEKLVDILVQTVEEILTEARST